ncbi:MAG: hypothetical protein PF445_10325 [Melioribacteraceae bacterium]|nr:hypothetical protein [Melioribacteraceae bacterium]
MNCDNCGALLRDKYPNIDLFSTIWSLIESPTSGLKKIIFADHKNYQIFILFPLVIKLVFTSFFLQSLFLEPVNYQKYFSVNFGIGAGFVTFLILLFPFLLKILLYNKSVITRYKDNLAITIYSHIPLVIFLLLVLPIEFALFGRFWIFSNPSPFMIKATAAYVFSFMEILAFVWTLILFGISIKIQSNSKSYSILITLIYSSILIGLFFVIPYLG